MFLQGNKKRKRGPFSKPTLQLKLLLHTCNASLTVVGNGVSPVYDLPRGYCFSSVALSSISTTYDPSLPFSISASVFFSSLAFFLLGKACQDSDILIISTHNFHPISPPFSLRFINFLISLFGRTALIFWVYIVYRPLNFPLVLFILNFDNRKW